MITVVIANYPIEYYDRPDERMLDLRPFGIDCIPSLGFSTFRKRHRGTVFHVHPGCIEICLCLKGKLMFESEDQEFDFLPSTVFVSGPDQPHRMRNNPRGLTVMSVLVAHPRGRKTILELPRDESDRLLDALSRFPRRLFAATSRLKSAFSRLFSLYDAKVPDKRILTLEMRCAVLELLLAVIEASAKDPLKFPTRLKSIADRMRAEPGKDYPVSDIAREIGLSEARVTETFKRITGLPPHAWLIECRLHAAQEMLAVSNDSIASISDKLGFSSPQHFAGAFLKSVGLTPRDWRKRSRKRKHANVISKG